LKRRLDEMKESTHTAIQLDEEYGGTGKFYFFELNTFFKVDECNESDLVERLSRCCSFSSIHSSETNISGSSSWIEVEQASFKDMCDKYEKRRPFYEISVQTESMNFFYSLWELNINL
jgi:hypothetical protein